MGGNNMKRIGIASILMMVMLIMANVVAAGSAAQKTSSQGKAMPGSSGMSMEMVKATEIIDINIVNPKGEELGEVKDLVFSKDGQISYLIVSRGGVFGMGEDLVPIPWSAAHANFRDDKLVVNIDKERLDQAPRFKSDDWDEFYSNRHQDEVRGYYGEGTTGTVNPGTQKGSGAKSMAPGETNEMKEKPGTTPKTE
jgi:sporulation protein YlmC with PRC-barrel domain